MKSRPDIEVADIFREHIRDYLAQYKMPPEHYEVVCDIMNCRTAYLGGHIEKCDHCSAEHNAYNSCRNRHCPKCQSVTKERWLIDRKAELLPVIYFHNVFTLPHELNPVILCNKKVMLGILFSSVSQTLLQFGKNPKNGLGGKLGFMAFLHTWDQKLLGHFHLHCLVPGGVLSQDDKEWIPCKNNFLFHKKALSQVFRGKFMDSFQKAYDKGELIFPGKIQPLGTHEGVKKLKTVLFSKNWVVNIQDPIEKPEYVLEYAGRYTHRVAISNHRIKQLENGKVTFTYKNRDKGTTETETIEAVEFIRRFLLHVLPKGFMRIRHYGLLANRYKKENLKKCRALLGQSAEIPDEAEKTVQEIMLQLTGNDITLCRVCKKGTMQKVSKIPKHSGPNAFDIIHPVEKRNTG